MSLERSPVETDESWEIPEELAQHVSFSPASGHIRLFDQRMLLMHGDSLAQLRQELIEGLGVEHARAVLTRVGYQQGVADGQRVRQATEASTDEVLAWGPRLREMEGFVRNHPLERMRMNIERGEFWGNFVWSASWEAQAHVGCFGVGGRAACWMMVGYADGYSTTVTGIPIHWREMECVAMGHPRCRVVGQPIACWEGLDREDLGYLSKESFVGATDLGPATWAPDDEVARANHFEGFVGVSAGFNGVASLVRKVAPHDLTVLFKGESGVGKECFTRAMHSISPRAKGPLVSVNCAAIPADLVEAELFGVEQGAFTGADRSRPGRFERAHGGTLFLDEITSLPLSAQGKVLRALQEREVERVGGTEVIEVDVRIVAAANRDLREEVAAGRFRTDLFYRLNVFPIEIPPLRERREDIPLLVALFLSKATKRFGKKVEGLTRQAYTALWDYGWPGNVRELENMIERATVLVDEGSSIDVQHLFAGGELVEHPSFLVTPSGGLATSVETPEGLDPGADALSSEHLLDALLDRRPSFEELERMLLERALERSGGNVSATARLLGMGRGQVEYRLRKAGGGPPGG